MTEASLGRFAVIITAVGALLVACAQPYLYPGGRSARTLPDSNVPSAWQRTLVITGRATQSVFSA